MRAPSEAFGDYVVYEQLGFGGMATVHRAEQQGIAGFSKQVALKRMLPSAAADASLVKSFIREARLASHLHHANVAQTYDLGKVGDVYFIAMELVPGRNLREILQHCASVAGNMPLPIAMNIVNQIADALDYAHNLCDESGQPLGIIHRDVSPSNIIVGEGGVVKLIDFGIAKARGQGMTTMAGTIKGKFSYLSPEALYGAVDARSDLFALGIIAYELLTNRPLFQGKDDMDTLNRVKDMPLLPPSAKNPQVPPELDNIVMTALDRDPDKRWQRATALRQALTTETKRLGLIAHDSEVIEWIDRAFARAAHDEDSEPSIVISKHTVELAQGTVPDDFVVATDSLATTVRPSRSRPIQAQHDQQFDVKTLPDSPEAKLDRTADDWNAASAVQTKGERPSVRLEAVRDVMEWNAQTDATREVIQRLPDKRASAPPAVRAAPPQARTLLDAAAPAQARTPDERASASPALRPAAPQQARTLLDAAPTPQRPSAPHAVQRPSAPHAVQRPSAPHAVQPAFQREPDHIGLPLSGARTAPNLPRADSVTTPEIAPPGSSERGNAGDYLLAVLVIIAAGGAAAVVYFALPYLT